MQNDLYPEDELYSPRIILPGTENTDEGRRELAREDARIGAISIASSATLNDKEKLLDIQKLVRGLNEWENDSLAAEIAAANFARESAILAVEKNNQGVSSEEKQKMIENLTESMRENIRRMSGLADGPINPPQE